MLQGGSDNLVFCCLVEYLEYPEVEDYHDQAGDVEGPDTGPNDEVRIVEGADEWLLQADVLPVSLRPVVETEHDGEADGAGDGPAGRNGEVGGQGVVPMLAVEDGGGHREEPVQADGHQVEDGAGGADHVTCQVEITDRVGEAPPTPVGLKEIP